MRIGLVILFLLVGCLLCFQVPVISSELDANLDDLTKQITEKMGEKSKKKIAVVEFSDLNGNITDFGRYLSEALITRLVNSGKFEDVIERKLLAKIINENKLSLTDIVDPSSAKQLGKILGVDAIVSGTITDLGSKLEVNARLIGTEKGSIFAAASAGIVKDGTVSRLLATAGNQDGALSKSSSGVEQSKAPAASSLGVSPGMKFEFSDQEFRVREVFLVKLKSVEFLEGNHPQVNMTIENTFRQTRKVGVIKVKDKASLIDQDGESYPLKEVNVLSSTEAREIPPGVPLKFSIVYAAVPSTIKQLNVTFELGIPISATRGSSWGDVTFRNLKLK